MILSLSLVSRAWPWPATYTSEPLSLGCKETDHCKYKHGTLKASCRAANQNKNPRSTVPGRPQPQWHIKKEEEGGRKLSIYGHGMRITRCRFTAATQSGFTFDFSGSTIKIPGHHRHGPSCAAAEASPPPDLT